MADERIASFREDHPTMVPHIIFAVLLVLTILIALVFGRTKFALWTIGFAPILLAIAYLGPTVITFHPPLFAIARLLLFHSFIWFPLVAISWLLPRPWFVGWSIVLGMVFFFIADRLQRTQIECPTLVDRVSIDDCYYFAGLLGLLVSVIAAAIILRWLWVGGRKLVKSRTKERIHL